MDDIGFHGDIIHQIENDMETTEVTLHAAFDGGTAQVNS